MPIKHFCDDADALTIQSLYSAWQDHHHPYMITLMLQGNNRNKREARNWLIHKKRDYRGHNPTSEAGGQRLGGANCPKGKGFFGEREIDGLHW